MILTTKCLPPINEAIRKTLARKGITYEQAADTIMISPRQFGRQMRGEIKNGIIPAETVRDLYEAALIDKDTADMWYESAHQVYRFKKQKRPPLQSGLKREM